MAGSDKNNTAKLDNPDNYGWPDEGESHNAMECVLGHYLMKYEIVQKKLNHAHEATKKSMQEIEDICSRYEMSAPPKEFENVKKLDGLWTQVMDVFKKSGLSEEELENIDGAMAETPRAIREYYDILIEQDSVLKSLIKEMSSESFHQAFMNARALTEEIQSRPNVMSGLSNDEYEPSNDDQDQKVKAFKFMGLPENPWRKEDS